MAAMSSLKPSLVKSTTYRKKVIINVKNARYLFRMSKLAIKGFSIAIAVKIIYISCT